MKYLKIISIAIVEFLFVLPCSAYDFEADGIFYNILSGKTNEVEVTRGSSYLEGYYNNSYNGDVIIPASVSHLGVMYNVTSIGARAFKDSKERVTSVSMPNTIEVIKSDAFYLCTGLKNITFSESLVTIETYAFYGCNALSSIELPTSLSCIGSHAFQFCESLKFIEIPSQIQTIKNDTFEDCYSLQSVKFPKSLNTIESAAFSGCKSLKDISFPNTLLTIGQSAFNSCSSLTTIVLPASLTSLGRYAFNNCSSLLEVDSEITEPFTTSGFYDNFPAGVILYVPYGTKEKYINKGWNKYFSEIVEKRGTFSLSITSIGNGRAIYDNNVITNQTLSFTLEEGNSTTISFFPDTGYRIASVKVNNTNVTSSVTNNQYTISNISANTTVEVTFEAIPPTTYKLSITASGNGCVSYNNTTIKNKTQSFTVNEGASATVTFSPDSGYRIANVKVNNTNVTSSIVNNQHTISNITANTTVEATFEAIPPKTYSLSIKATGSGGVTYGNTTIRNRTQTFTINEGSSATITIAPDTDYRIASVKVNGTDVTSNLSNNFYTISNIASETSVEAEFEAIPSIISFVDSNVKSLCVANWDTDGDGELSKAEAMTVSDVGTVFKKTEIESFDELKYFLGLTQIPSGAFNNCKKLTRIQIPNNVTTIEGYTFFNCQDLSSITMPDGVVSIGTEAFRYCSSLNDFSFPESLKTIGSRAFEGCTSLSKISLPESITFVDQGAFASSGISHIDLSINMTTISHQTFSLCKNLSSITIPGNIKNIGSNAFELCTQLSTVNIENGIQTIESSAFGGCSSLESIFIPQSVTSISSVTPFSSCSSLATIVVDQNNSKYDSRDNCNAIILTSTNTLVTGCKGTIIPSSVTSIGDYSFNGCYGIYNLSLPNSIKSIGKSAFQYCYDLSTLVIPNSVTSIGDGAFFACNKLSTVNSEIEEPFEIANTVFRDISSNSKLHVPFGSKSKYEMFAGWTKYFAEIVEEAPTTYSLSIKATGNGNISYNNTAIRNQTQTFTINEGTSATVTFSPDSGNRIASVKVNNTDVTSKVSNNSYTISNISANTTLEVEFEVINYTLSISATGNGTATYNNTEVRGSTRTFTVNQGMSATISFLPESGNSLNSVMVNGMDVTSKVTSSRYTISNIRANTTLEVTFIEDITSITAEGVSYKVVSQSDKTINLASGDYGQVLTVPTSVTSNDKTWKIVGIEQNALKGNTELAAVIWNPSIVFNAEINNPNLLLYVKDEAYAPATIQNVVVNNTADKIVLTEAANGNNFYCPQAFTARQISYTHHYNMQTGVEESRGWETIALPFDVQTITHENKGNIKAFANWNHADAEKPFWLYELTGSGFVEASNIKANTPYIISMPNHPRYDSEWLLKGTVTFAASNVTVNKTEDVNKPTYSDRTFIPCFATKESDAGIYSLNVNNDFEKNTSGMTEGSKFVLNMRKVHPFEAYMTTTTVSNRAIGIFDGMSTDIRTIENMDGQDENSYYDLQGRKTIAPTKKGVYIKNRKKVIIK